jgi:small GTP-binding protein
MSIRKLLFKTIVVGDGGVGKSTMIQRLITGQFVPMKITIGTDLATYDIQIDANTIIKLQIWDFAGEKRFRFFLPNYSKGAYGAILCFDITRYVSFENLVEWYNIVNDNAADPVFILVGGKLDLAGDKRAVSREEALAFKEEYKLDYYIETSSKSGENNRDIFETLTKAILEKKKLV